MQLSDGGVDPTVPELQEQLNELFANLGRAINRQRRTDPTMTNRLEYGVLARLAPGCTLRLGELADAEGLDPSTMSRRVALLEERDLIARHPDPEDGRAQRIAITAAGRDLLAATRAAQVALVTDALAGWHAAERGDLTRLLARLNDALVAGHRPPHEPGVGPTMNPTGDPA